MSGHARSIPSSPGVWFQRVASLTVKELRQLYRDPILMLFILYAFTLDIYLAGSGVSLELKQARLFVQDHDRSTASRELIHRFRPPYFRFMGETADERRGIALLDRGEAMLVLDIPEHFEKRLLEDESADVLLLVDTTNSVLGFLASSYAAEIVSGYGMEVGMRRAGLGEDALERMPLIENQARVWFNPNQNNTWFMSLTELLNIITVLVVLLPAAALVREKERGTIEQLLVSPLSPFQIVLPKIAAMSAVILAGTALCLFSVLGAVFHLPFRGSLLFFFAVTALYVFTTAGLGVLAATFARNMAQVGMLTVLMVAPMLFLSGNWTPPEAMNRVMVFFMTLSPLHYFIDASFGILLKGAGLKLLWDDILAMALIGATVFGIGLWRFRRQFH
ncbi:ABC-2 type transporter [uncultured Desulfatiglans sp.]|nr:ABC-2 type transporter [uncultured Desulfatiglans sp.]